MDLEKAYGWLGFDKASSREEIEAAYQRRLEALDKKIADATTKETKQIYKKKQRLLREATVILLENCKPADAVDLPSSDAAVVKQENDDVDVQVNPDPALLPSSNRFKSPIFYVPSILLVIVLAILCVPLFGPDEVLDDLDSQDETVTIAPAEWTITVLDELQTKVDIATDEINDGPLPEDAVVSDVGRVKQLVAQGKDINGKDDKGRTLMHIAAEKGDTRLLKYLIGQGFDISEQDNDKCTALDFAAKGGHDELLKYLVEQGADINRQRNSGSTALHWAATSDNEKLVTYLISQGADVNAKDGVGETPLCKAVTNGRMEIVTLFVNKGADVRVKNKDRKSMLYIACSIGHADMAELMIDRYFGSSYRLKYDMDSLSVAAANGHIEIVELLISNGFGVNSRSRSDVAALFFAAENGYIEIVELLLANDANIEGRPEKVDIR